MMQSSQTVPKFGNQVQYKNHNLIPNDFIANNNSQHYRPSQGSNYKQTLANAISTYKPQLFNTNASTYNYNYIPNSNYNNVTRTYNSNNNNNYNNNNNSNIYSHLDNPMTYLNKYEINQSTSPVYQNQRLTNTSTHFQTFKTKPYFGSDWKFQPKSSYEEIQQQKTLIKPEAGIKKTKIITVQKESPLIQTVNQTNWNQFYEKQQQQLQAPPPVVNKVQRKQSCNNAIWAILGVICLAGLAVGLFLFLNSQNQQVKIKQVSATDAKYQAPKTISPSSNKTVNSTTTSEAKSTTTGSKTIVNTIEPIAVQQKIIQPLISEPVMVTSSLSPLLMRPETKTQETQQIVGSKIVYMTNSQYNKIDQGLVRAVPVANGYESEPMYVQAIPVGYSSNKISYQIPMQNHFKSKIMHIRRYQQ